MFEPLAIRTKIIFCTFAAIAQQLNSEQLRTICQLQKELYNTECAVAVLISTHKPLPLKRTSGRPTHFRCRGQMMRWRRPPREGATNLDPLLHHYTHHHHFTLSSLRRRGKESGSFFNFKRWSFFEVMIWSWWKERESDSLILYKFNPCGDDSDVSKNWTNSRFQYCYWPKVQCQEYYKIPIWNPRVWCQICWNIMLYLEAVSAPFSEINWIWLNRYSWKNAR